MVKSIKKKVLSSIISRIYGFIFILYKWRLINCIKYFKLDFSCYMNRIIERRFIDYGDNKRWVL